MWWYILKLLWSRLVFASKNISDVFGFGVVLRIDSQVLRITAKLMKKKKKIILCDMKWEVVLCHAWLLRLLLSSVGEKTIWGNNGPCRSPIAAVFCSFSLRFSVVLHFGGKYSRVYNTEFITCLLPLSWDIWNYCILSLKPHNLQEIVICMHLKKSLKKDLWALLTTLMLPLPRFTQWPK